MTKTEQLVRQSVNYRGLILQNCIHLERAIDTYIVKYLSDDDVKQLDIFVFLLDRMSFDAKISVLQSILQRDNADYKKKYDKLMGKIRQAKDERNIFAHYSLKTDMQAVKSFPTGLTYMAFRNKVDHKPYTNEKILELIEIINNCTEEIEKITK